MNTLLSFVIPCYRSEKTISRVREEIVNTMSQRSDFDYEIICVNDCSPDNVYEVLKKMAFEDHKVKVINFAKNMGKHAAVLAGYAVARGEYIVNLDDDMQCPVNELWKLVDKVLDDSCDVAMAKYYEKKESKFKRFGSYVNFMMTNLMLDKPKDMRSENFSVMKRFVTDEMVKYKNPYPYLDGLMYRVTKKVAQVEMEQRDRGDDLSTGFTFKKSLSLWINGLTAFSVKPLRVASFTGVLFSAIGFIYGIVIIIERIIGKIVVPGYGSILAVILFTSGLIMAMLGLIGEYLGRIYICINDSPQYVIKEMINVEKEL